MSLTETTTQSLNITGQEVMVRYRQSLNIPPDSASL